ncbi:hypothetical protein WJX73_001574 [Symbiochloris irregularis]|uniref:Uncharacterized protein n=1 Tax=Symbiochloris irregularis TaxID=706552 RepID=A0AAW1NVY3_9CHLO
MTRDQIDSEWQTVPRDFSRLQSWQRLFRDSKTGKQPFPGLQAQFNNNGSAQLQVLRTFWDSATAQSLQTVIQYLEDIEELIEYEELGVLQACKEPRKCMHIVNWIIALKQYSDLNKSYPREDKLQGVYQRARIVFGKLQKLLHKHLSSLLTHSQGFMALCRMNQFSLPAALFEGCSQLFSEQASYHRQYPNNLTHVNAGRVLTETLAQLNRTKPYQGLPGPFRKLLEGLLVYFDHNKCELCFPEATRTITQDLVYSQAYRDTVGDDFMAGSMTASLQPQPAELTVSPTKVVHHAVQLPGFGFRRVHDLCLRYMQEALRPPAHPPQEPQAQPHSAAQPAQPAIDATTVGVMDPYLSPRSVSAKPLSQHGVIGRPRELVGSRLSRGPSRHADRKRYNVEGMHALRNGGLRGALRLGHIHQDLLLSSSTALATEVV